MYGFLVTFVFVFHFFIPTTHCQYKPHTELKELFEKVQLSDIFPDSKTFVDCIPKKNPKRIVADYLREKESSDFDLKKFVFQNFIIPQPKSDSLSSHFPPIEKHINLLWNQLIRIDSGSSGSLIALPHPYIVPGGRFNEQYYWDSYFTMLGLKQANKIDIIQNMVDNFDYLIKSYGFIPNGNRTYYLSRSQPPFFAMMIELLASLKGDSVYFIYLESLQKEYDFWMAGKSELSAENPAELRVVRVPDGNILNRYWDSDTLPRPEAYKEDVITASSATGRKGLLYRNIRAAAESGWDFSSRWFRDGTSLASMNTTSIVPIDLNCLLYQMEKTLVKIYQLKKDKSNSEHYLKLSENRKRAIQKYCWNSETTFFMDYNYLEKKCTEIKSLAGVFPLYFSIATKDQAAFTAHVLTNYFLYPGGLVTTLVMTKQQWDAPNAWAPLQWIACKGLRNYGLKTLAEEIANRWCENNRKVYASHGKLMEKYNAVFPAIPGGGGEYPAQDGFGWTNGVYLDLLNDQPFTK